MDGSNKTAEEIMGEIQDLRQIIADFEAEDTALEDLKEQLHQETEDHNHRTTVEADCEGRTNDGCDSSKENGSHRGESHADHPDTHGLSPLRVRDTLLKKSVLECIRGGTGSSNHPKQNERHRIPNALREQDEEDSKEEKHGKKQHSFACLVPQRSQRQSSQEPSECFGGVEQS